MTLRKHGYMPRLADDRLERLLGTFGAVCIEGPKGCGKTWTAMNRSKSVFDLTDPSGGHHNRRLASIDVSQTFIGKTPLLIDEWQTVPAIWDATRIKVDESRDTGRYILAGSSTPVTKGVYHDGTGRIGTMRMRTMSLLESGDSDGSVSLGSMFAGGDVFSERRSTSVRDLADLIVRGGWPAAVGKDTVTAMRLSADIVAETPGRARRMDGIERNGDKIGMLIGALARNEGTVASISGLTEDIERNDDGRVSEQSASVYLDILGRMFVTEELPAYRPGPRTSVRVAKGPKRYLTDPSLAAAAMDLAPEELVGDLDTLDRLFQSMCVRDLSVYADALGGNVFHYRDGKRRGIDAIVKLQDGRFGAFDIATGTDGIERRARNLVRMGRVFEDNSWPEPSFMCVLCGTAPAPYRRSDGVYVVPIRCLRNRCIISDAPISGKVTRRCGCVHCVYCTYTVIYTYRVHRCREGTMEIVISNSSGRPIYEQIADQVRSQIISGELAAGDPLPSMRALAQSLKVSLITTKRAYNDLEAEGFIVTVAGKGCFVAARDPALLREAGLREAESHMREAVAAARRSGLTKDDLRGILDIEYDGE